MLKFLSKLKFLKLRGRAANVAAATADADADAGAVDDNELHFDFSHDDLTNVVQFLSLAVRTGSLKVESDATGESGVVGFDRGAVRFVQFADFDGTEAMARMMRTKGLTGEFIDHDELSESNVEAADNEQLLTEAANRAGRLSERGTEKKHFVKKLARNQGKADEKEEAEEEEEEKDDAHAKSVVEGESPPEPVDDTIATQKTIAFDPTQERRADNGEVQKSGSRKREIFVVFIIVALAFAILGGGLWWVKGKLDQGRELELAEKRERQERLEADSAKARAGNFLDAAREQFELGEYDQALRQITQALAAAPQLADALELRRQVNMAKFREAALPVRAETQQALEKLQNLDADDFFKQKIGDANKQVAVAEKQFGDQQYQAALGMYQQALLRIMTIVREIEAFNTAGEQREKTMAERGKAGRVNAAGLAQKQWRLAEDLFKKGVIAFADENYGAAGESWNRALEEYRTATKTAVAAAEKMELAQAFASAVESFGRDRLEMYAPDAWAALKQRREQLQNRDAGTHEQIKTMWRETLDELEKTIKLAEKREADIKYQRVIGEARSFMDAGEWQSALNKLLETKIIKGYENDEFAAELLAKVGYELELARARKSLGAGDWTGVLEAANTALEFNPTGEEATRLTTRAQDELIPRLTVVVKLNGRVVDDAQVAVEGMDQAFTAPVTFKLKLNQIYRLSATLPPTANTYYDTARIKYKVDTPGRQRIDLEIVELKPPKPGDVWNVPGIEKMVMKPVAAGSFKMGNAGGKPDERPVHEVRISQPFWMAAYETTNAQYRQFLDESGYTGEMDAIGSYVKHFRDGGSMPVGAEFPVVYVSWENARHFAEWLTRRERDGGRLPPGYEYRLPTEAEWEYCCRAGDENAAVTAPTRENAWFSQADGTRQTGTKRPNAWGLFDMSGNVWEWCRDYHGQYSEQAQTDPTGPQTGVFRVIRGGSWSNVAALCSCTYRSQASAKEAKANIGFRIVLAPVAGKR